MNIPCRKEELYALNLILDHLRKTNLFPIPITEPNGASTAPDFLLDFGTSEVNLEVTISGDGFIFINDDSKHVEKRELYDRSTDKMLKKLEDLIATWIGPKETIILTCLTHLPSEKRGQLAKKISEWLQKSYLCGQLSLNNPVEFNISTASERISQVKFKAQLTKLYGRKPEYSSLKVILAGSLQSPNPVAQASLSLQTQYILQDKITKKNNQVSKFGI